MKRKRRTADRDPASYQSKDLERRARQLGNLPNLAGRTTATTWKPGDAPGLRHGGYSAALVADVSAEVRELMDALALAAPVRDVDGGLPAADVVAVERTARVLRRYRKLEAWLDLHGEIDEKTGDVKPAARLAGELGAALARALGELGMNPAARAKLGLDLVRTRDLAQEMSAIAEADRLEALERRETPDA